MRRNLPIGVRQLLRVGRHLVRRGEASPSLPAHLIEGCRFSASRYDLVAALPGAGRIAEIGTFKGDFARHILASCNPHELHLVDLDSRYADVAPVDEIVRYLEDVTRT